MLMKVLWEKCIERKKIINCKIKLLKKIKYQKYQKNL